ncbi:hypothetical protein [Paenibacillus montanisoli]|uniref:Uncharacterized protein n=1 Tax=Paenibacillus montanisoli TaxID=2081970 RepID=A0A328U1M8_9BACL|nr:hypothetical protein [Paenibacillus montanisoli]RAP74795.1 hypothetical protein DL346_22420 [Paenibacillus montanisoli]
MQNKKETTLKGAIIFLGCCIIYGSCTFATTNNVISTDPETKIKLDLILDAVSRETQETVQEPVFETGNGISYEQFQDSFLKFKKNFSSSNFISISPEEVNLKTTSLPHHHFGSSKIDAINNDINTPRRLENYYKSNQSSMLIKVDFIYMPNVIEDSFLTISSINNKDNTNIEEKYQTIDRPHLDDYYITMNGMLIVIKFLDTSTAKGQDDKKYDAFIKEELLFYQDFEKAIK